MIRMVSPFLRGIGLLGLFLLAAPNVTAQSLGKRLDRILDTPPFDRQFWGVLVTDTAGRRLYARNADRLFIPASNMKLLVTAAATALLDTGFRVETSVYAGGPIAGGVLTGDLVLYGRGDPTMSRRCYAVDTMRAGACDADPLAPLARLADQVAAAGVREVTGDLIGDGSYFEPLLRHPSWEGGDLAWWYAAPVSGLGVNDNSLDVTVSPDTIPGAPTSAGVTPAPVELVLANRSRTSDTAAPRTFDLHWEQPGWQLVATGDVPAGARPRTEYVAVPDPNHFAASLFRALLARRGVAVRGATRSTTDSTSTRAARAGPPLAIVASRPVSDWLFPILNTSQNWFAEMLVKQLGKAFGHAGSWVEGTRVVRRWLIDSVGVDSTEVRLDDASGLSSADLVTPNALVRILRYMRAHPRYAVFAAGLPRSGAPGSLRDRFRETPLAGRIVAKTGTITTVNTLSGFIERPGRGTLVFSVLANHHAQGSRAMIAAIDSVVAAIAR